MIKKLPLLALGTAVALGVSAAPVSPEAALQRARSNSPAKARGLVQRELKLAHTAYSEAGQAAAYVFNTPGRAGFTILAADDVAMPVLGYSDTETFDADNMPSQLRWWLSEYGRQVEYATAHGATEAYKAPARKASYPAIAPLITTKWNQTEPYNNLTPMQSGVHCPTGCVATSFAQAMSYFKYPEKGTGTVSYRWSGRTLSLNLDRVTINWDKMKDVYVSGDYTTEEATAVAYLMMACGYSVEMNYTADSSGALSNKIVNALTKYFGYSKEATYEDRGTYTADEWDEMIYNNLKDYGPVIYNGTSPLDGGHSFIVDGYDGNGYYHLNWGWGGTSDGYYALNVLTPEIQGVGGAMGGFNYSQDAVLKMHKPTSADEEYPEGRLNIWGAAKGTLSGKLLQIQLDDYPNTGWYNVSSYDVNLEPGAIISGEGYKESVPGVMYLKEYKEELDRISLGSGMMYKGSAISFRVNLPEGLADGRYTVTLATKDLNKNGATFLPMRTFVGYPNYVILNVKNGSYTIENASIGQLTFEDVKLTTDLYYGKYAKLSAKVSNNTDVQLTQCIAPVLLLEEKGVKRANFQADAFMVTVDPHSTIETEWIVNFLELNTSSYSSPTTYKLSLLDIDSKKYLADFGNVTMTTLSGSTSVKFGGITIEGAEKQTMTIDGVQYRNVNVVPNFDNMKVNFKYSVTRGYLDSGVTCGIYSRMGTNAVYIPMQDNFYSEQPFMSAGESKDLNFDVNFPEGEPNKIYYMRAQWANGSSYTYLGQISFMSTGSGVDGIEAEDSAAEAEYYNLQGVRVSNPENGQILIRRKNGKAEKVRFHE